MTKRCWERRWRGHSGSALSWRPGAVKTGTGAVAAGATEAVPAAAVVAADVVAEAGAVAAGATMKETAEAAACSPLAASRRGRRPGALCLGLG